MDTQPGTAGLLPTRPPGRGCLVAKELLHEGALRGFERGYEQGYRQGAYGWVPSWFTGHDNDGMASYYFDQLSHMAAVLSVHQVESDLSGGLKPP